MASGLRLSRTPFRVRVAAPDLGQHSEEVLREYGYSDAEIAGLQARGIITTHVPAQQADA